MHSSILPFFLTGEVACRSTTMSQEIDGFFVDDGSIYCIKAPLIKKGDRFGKNIGTKVTSRRENIDVDDEFDFTVAQTFLESGGNG